MQGVHKKEVEAVERTPPGGGPLGGRCLERVHLQGEGSPGVVESAWSGSNWRRIAAGQGVAIWSEMDGSEGSPEGGPLGGRRRGLHIKGNLEGGGGESTWRSSTSTKVEGRLRFEETHLEKSRQVEAGSLSS